MMLRRASDITNTATTFRGSCPPWALRPRCGCHVWQLPRRGAEHAPLLRSRRLDHRWTGSSAAGQNPRDHVWMQSAHRNQASTMVTLDVALRSGRAEDDGTVEEKQRTLQELQHLTGLHVNDLWSLHSGRQRILGRALIQPRGGRAILVRVGPIRAVLLADRCLLFDATESTTEYFAKAVLQPLVELQPLVANHWMGVHEQVRSFEIDCLDAILGIASRRLRRRADCFGPVVDHLLTKVVPEEPEASLAQVLSISRALLELERSCSSIVKCLEDVLASSDDMREMLLTEGDTPVAKRLEQVEAILESYLFAFRSIGDQLFLSHSAIETTQHAARISLEHKRTRLLALNVHLTVATLSVGVVAAIGGLLGMNVPIPFGLAEESAAFGGITACAVLTALVVHGASVALLTRKPKVGKLQQLYRARQLASRTPDLADVLLKRLESYSMLPMSIGDAHLTFDEFCELVRSETSRDLVDVKELREMFDVLDSNDDGRLQLAEIGEFLCVLSSPLSGVGIDRRT